MSEDTGALQDVASEAEKALDYAVLNAQQKVQIIENKLLQFEARHYELTIDAKLDETDEVTKELLADLESKIAALRELLP